MHSVPAYFFDGLLADRDKNARRIALFQSPTAAIPISAFSFGLFRRWVEFHHRFSGMSRQIQEMKASFLPVQTRPETILELTGIAEQFQQKALLEFMCQSVAKLVETKSVQELRELFKVKDRFEEGSKTVADLVGIYSDEVFDEQISD